MIIINGVGVECDKSHQKKVDGMHFFRGGETRFERDLVPSSMIFFFKKKTEQTLELSLQKLLTC